LHYHLNQRSEPFWKACAAMPIPDTLAERIALFSDAAQAYQSPDDLFRVSSWTQVMLGQRLEPRDWHRLARMMPPERLGSSLAELKAGIAQQVERLPVHQAFVDRYCAQTATEVAA
jgi:tryptophan halogenase